MRRTLAYGVAAAVLAVAAVALPLVGIRLRADASDALEDLERGERHLDAAFLAAVSAESGVRGFVITGDRAFLAPYETGYVSFVEQMAGAMRGAMDNERLLAALDTVAHDMESWLAGGARPEVTAVEQGRMNDAQVWTAGGIGKTMFDSLRAHTNAALIVYSEEQSTAREELDEATLWMLLLGGIGLLCAFAVVAIVVHETTAYQVESERHGVTRGKLSEARLLNRQRADLLAAASHDLRNPLGAIVMAADVLKDGAKESGDEDLSTLADQVAAAAQRTAMLVGDLLDFTRVEAGKLHIERRPLDPVEVVQEAVNDLRLWRPSAVVDVQADVNGGARLVGDPKRLRSAIRNLLENACYYANAPYRIRVLTKDEMVEIHVEDAGPGIPVDERPVLFEQFRRGSTSSGREGTGIGLYICRGILEQHGGQLEISDSELGGSDFVCRVPLLPAA